MWQAPNTLFPKLDLSFEMKIQKKNNNHILYRYTRLAIQEMGEAVLMELKHMGIKITNDIIKQINKKVGVRGLGNDKIINNNLSVLNLNEILFFYHLVLADHLGLPPTKDVDMSDVYAIMHPESQQFNRLQNIYRHQSQKKSGDILIIVLYLRLLLANAHKRKRKMFWQRQYIQFLYLCTDEITLENVTYEEDTPLKIIVFNFPINDYRPLAVISGNDIKSIKKRAQILDYSLFDSIIIMLLNMYNVWDKKDTRNKRTQAILYFIKTNFKKFNLIL